MICGAQWNTISLSHKLSKKERASCALCLYFFNQMELCGNLTASACTFTTSNSSSCLSFALRRKKKSSVFCRTNGNENNAFDHSKEVIKRTVAVTGATGFIGRRLVQKLHSDNHRVLVLTRARSNARLIFSDKDFPGIVIAEEPEWRECIHGSNAVVNLAGNSLSVRWSSEVKKEIKESRIRVTSKVVDIINDARDELRPAVMISATAVGYYGTSETQVFDEESTSGTDYLAEVCIEWEAAALKVNKNVRLSLIRMGVVLGKDGGALAKMIPFFKMFAGGPLGSGRQWFSWIHVDDIVNLMYEALSNSSYRGVINGTAPNPVRLAMMCEHLGNAMSRPSWLPVPAFALKAILGEGSSLVLDGQRVIPTRARELGFQFKYSYVKDALESIIS